MVPPGDLSEKVLAGSSSFSMDAFVSLTSAPQAKRPVKNTGAFQTVVLHYALPFTESSIFGTCALVTGF